MFSPVWLPLAHAATDFTCRILVFIIYKQKSFSFPPAESQRHFQAGASLTSPSVLEFLLWTPLNGVFSSPQISPSDLPHCNRSVRLSSSVIGSVSHSFSLHSFLGSALSPLCTVRHAFLPLVSCGIILSQPRVCSCDLGLELTVSRLLLLLLCGFFSPLLRLFCGS